MDEAAISSSNAGMNEARLLRIAVAAACMVPIIAGGASVLLGPAMVGLDIASITADSHYRYLSGPLLGIGVLFLTTVPRIETSTARFRLLAIIVIGGGLGRLLGALLNHNADASSLFADRAMPDLWPDSAIGHGRTAGLLPASLPSSPRLSRGGARAKRSW